MVSVDDKSSSDVKAEHSEGMSLDRARRAALAEVDNAAFSWFHVKICIVAGIGFFTDAYGIFAINIASTMLGYVYGAKGSLTTNQDLGVKVATPVGTFIGQLFFGFLADQVGRKRMYGVELMIIIIATFAQALAGSAPSVHVIGAICVWRGIAGVGVGGDYPLSAVISSEFASTRIRGRMMAATFSAQGWGQFTAALVGLICVAAYHGPIINSTAGPTHIGNIDPIWRLVVGFGCVPGCIALYFRLTIPETPRFTMDIERNIQQASLDIKAVMAGGRGYVDPDAPIHRAEAPRASWADFRAHFGKWENGKVLLGTAWSWFALDIAFYGLGLNNSIILKQIGFGAPASTVKGNQLVYVTLKNICIGNLVLSVAGLIPGYYASFLLIDSWGRKPIQLMGFTVLTILFVIMGFAYDKLTATAPARGAFVFLYCLTNFFQNFGPNTTTFTIPGEAFPTRYRSTAHGISAATGKLGAIVAQVGFARLKDRGGAPGSNHWLKHIMEVFALFMLTGIFSTLLIPETKQKSLEELSNENQEGFVRGEVGHAPHA